MQPRTLPAERRLAIDELERAILNLTAAQTARDYELLVMIREFDEAGSSRIPARRRRGMRTARTRGAR